MKVIQHIKKKSILLILGFTLSTVSTEAQIGFPEDVDDEAPAAPIDGMIGVAIAAGAYLGFRKKNFPEEK